MIEFLRSLIKWTLGLFGYQIFNLNGVQIRRRRSGRPLHDYDVSVVLPFYKKLAEFKEVLPVNAPFFERNGIEVIIVMDEPSEEAALIEYIKTYPFVNWRVIVNDTPHDWRNPVKTINVGIRHAERANILVMSPESKHKTDMIQIFTKEIIALPKRFITGYVAFDNSKLPWVPYGSIFAPRKAFEAIRGYDEAYSEWGADDDDVRLRLTRAGYKQRSMNSARAVHAENEKRPRKKLSKSNKEVLNKNRSHTSAVTNDENWGRDFSRVAYDYRNNQYAAELCQKYLETLETFSIAKPEAFNRSHRVIALIQCRNNPDINETLDHVARHSDGIVLLDDQSTDGTYEKAAHPALIVKAKKKRDGFNDLENRNILLNMASFIRSEWFYWIDTDERLDERFESPLEAANRESDVLQFNMVHLWDDVTQYRVDYPTSDRGVCTRNRMFRNRGRLQIRSRHMMHPDLVPYESTEKELTRVLLVHYGNLSAMRRKERYDFYLQEDKKRVQGYSHLISESVRIGKLSDIKL